MSLKRVLLSAARSIGLLAAVRNSRWRRSRLLILCYHGASARGEHEWNPELYITADRLRRRLELLRRDRYALLQLSEAVTRLSQGTLPPRTVAITFDDGARDFAEHAVPVLQDFEAPATVYLTTYYCDHRLPVFDTALSYLLWKGRQSGTFLRDVIAASDPLSVASAPGRERAWRAVYDFAYAASMSGDEKHTLLERVARRLGVDFDEFRRACSRS
jgi:hypothetical protein